MTANRIPPRYPVYVISKGRHDCCLTAKFMINDGCPFSLVVEPQEEKKYRKAFPDAKIHVLPFKNLGMGSVPARNWVWEHSMSAGYSRHWILDDNIRYMVRRYKCKRIRCESNLSMRACEDFVDRYKNIAIAGMNYDKFVPDNKRFKPFFLNVHVYSNLLIRNDLHCRWRGKYNEDTDLCLQVLSGGWCTVLFNAFLIKKATTMTMKGGNASIYKEDGRTAMARSLERLWPGVVKTKRRFNRPQHVIKNNWKGFDTPLMRKDSVDWENINPNEYGMKLNQKADVIKSPVLRKLVDEYREQGENPMPGGTKSKHQK